MSGAPKTCKRFLLQHKAVGEVKLGGGDDATFKLEDYELPALKDVRILLST